MDFYTSFYDAVRAYCRPMPTGGASTRGSSVGGTHLWGSKLSPFDTQQ